MYKPGNRLSNKCKADRTDTENSVVVQLMLSPFTISNHCQVLDWTCSLPHACPPLACTQDFSTASMYPPSPLLLCLCPEQAVLLRFCHIIVRHTFLLLHINVWVITHTLGCTTIHWFTGAILLSYSCLTVYVTDTGFTHFFVNILYCATAKSYDLWACLKSHQKLFLVLSWNEIVFS